MWIDSHAHLFEFADEQIPDLIQEAANASVLIVISTATNIKTSTEVVNHCKRFDSVFGAAGISPFDVLELSSEWLSQLRSLLNNPKMIAIGEIGIDRSNPRYPQPQYQLPVFERQLSLAVELDLPAVIHSRGAENEAADVCHRLGVKKALFHCFTGDYNSVRKILDYGYFVSFSGIITFKNATVRELVSKVPVDRLLIETDTPYLSPAPFRGQKNRPAWVRYVGEEMALLVEKKPEEFQDILQNNFKKLFFDQ